MEPRIERYLHLHPEVRFVPLDIDSLGWNHPFVETYSVNHVPTLVLLGAQGKLLPLENLEDILDGLE